MSRDYAIHPDLLVHWTGEDFDPDCCRDSKGSSKAAGKKELSKEELEEKYLRRLRDLLKYGLWMTPQSMTGVEWIDNASDGPEVPRVCFTELRLSLARAHARRYGRLGIGFKRPFLFDRGGRPVVYCGAIQDQQHDVFLHACCQHMPKRFLHFFKRIYSGSREFEYYDESEWRIVLTPELTKSCHIIDPRSNPCPDVRDYWNGLSAEEREKLRLLLPLDGWLSCIIYPSVSLKSKALQHCEIREEINRLKTDPRCRANRPEVEAGNWPVEIDLDLCRNF